MKARGGVGSAQDTDRGRGFWAVGAGFRRHSERLWVLYPSDWLAVFSAGF